MCVKKKKNNPKPYLPCVHTLSSQIMILCPGKPGQPHGDVVYLDLVFYWDTCQLELELLEHNQGGLITSLPYLNRNEKLYKILYPNSEKSGAVFGLKFHSFCG